MGIGSGPDDLISEASYPEDRIHEDSQVMARCRIAVQVQAPLCPENPLKLHKAGRHHGEVGKHVVLAQLHSEGLHRSGKVGVRPLYDGLIGFGGLLVPMPGVCEDLYLSAGLGSILLFEENVVILIALERRIQVNQVDRLIRDVVAENFKIVAEV